MGKIAIVLICVFRVFAQSYPCCPRTFGTTLVQVHERVIHHHFNEMEKNLNKLIWLEPE